MSSNSTSYLFQNEHNETIELRLSFKKEDALATYFLNFYHNGEEIDVPVGIELWVYTAHKNQWRSKSLTMLPSFSHVNDGFRVTHMGQILMANTTGDYFVGIGKGLHSL